MVFKKKNRNVKKACFFNVNSMTCVCKMIIMDNNGNKKIVSKGIRNEVINKNKIYATGYGL